MTAEIKTIARTYRNYDIVKFSNADLRDPELKGVEYHVYAQFDKAHNNSIEVFPTLWQAKYFVDRCIEAGRA